MCLACWHLIKSVYLMLYLILPDKFLPVMWTLKKIFSNSKRDTVFADYRIVGIVADGMPAFCTSVKLPSCRSGRCRLFRNQVSPSPSHLESFQYIRLYKAHLDKYSALNFMPLLFFEKILLYFLNCYYNIYLTNQI